MRKLRQISFGKFFLRATYDVKPSSLLYRNLPYEVNSDVLPNAAQLLCCGLIPEVCYSCGDITPMKVRRKEEDVALSTKWQACTVREQIIYLTVLSFLTLESWLVDVCLQQTALLRYTAFTDWSLCWKHTVFSVRYGMNFYTYVDWVQIFSGLSPRRPQFDPGPLYVRFVVDKVALGQIFLIVLRISPVSIISPVLHTHFHIHVALTSRTARRSVKTMQKAMLFRKSESIFIEKCFQFLRD
jgi:hypothetical protein